ncbi:MAG: hypothetical protein AB7C89_06900 [Intestinibacillus sp.]
MYNRYLNSAREASAREPTRGPEPPPPELHNEPPHAPPKAQPASNVLTGMGQALSNRLQSLHFDLDTLIVIMAIYFLVADSDDFDVELLILIGIMLVLGF